MPKPGGVSSLPSEAHSGRVLRLESVHTMSPKNVLPPLQAYPKWQLGALLYPFLGLLRVRAAGDSA